MATSNKLLNAIYNGNIDDVREMVESGIDINATISDVSQSLHHRFRTCTRAKGLFTRKAAAPFTVVYNTVIVTILRHDPFGWLTYYVTCF